MRGLIVVFAAALFGCRAAPAVATGDASATGAEAGAAASVDAGLSGQALVVQDCLGCHTEEMLQQQRLTPKQWAAVVKKMTGWGAPVEPETSDALTAYLSERYQPDAGPYAPPSITPAEAALAIAPLEDGPFANGDPSKGAAMYRDRCAACHGVEGRGQLGVNLVDRPILARAASFALVLRTGKGRMTPIPTSAPSTPDAPVSDGEVADVLAHLRTLKN